MLGGAGKAGIEREDKKQGWETSYQEDTMTGGMVDCTPNQQFLKPTDFQSEFLPVQGNLS